LSRQSDTDLDGAAESLARLAQLLASGRLRVRKLVDDSGVALDTSNGHVSLLNETATFIVEQIEAGATTPEQLVGRLTAAFEIDVATAARDLDAYLGQVVAEFPEDRQRP
jgi:hypothetical protein